MLSWSSTDAAELRAQREFLRQLDSDLSLLSGPDGTIVDDITTPVRASVAEPSPDGPIRVVWTQLGGVVSNLVPGFYEVQLEYFHPDLGGLFRVDTNRFRVLPHAVAHDLGRPLTGFEGTVVCPLEVACDDGVDNDTDGATDCADRNCEFLLTCVSGAFIDLGSQTNADQEPPGPVHSGDTSLLDDEGNPLSPDDHVLPCTFFAATAGDDEFRWTAPSDGTYTIDTVGSPLDTVLGVSTETEFFCSEDIDAVIWQSTVTLSLTAGDEVVIIVDGYGNDEGPYILNINQVE